MEVIKRLSILIEEWIAVLLETIKRWTPLLLDTYRRRVRPILVTIKHRIPHIRQALIEKAPFIRSLVEQANCHILRFAGKRSPLLKDLFMKSRLSPMLVVGLLGIMIVLIGGFTFESDVDNPSASVSAEQSKRDFDKEYEEALARTSYGTAATTITNTMTFNTLMGQ
jgi:hypothetical protein